MGAVAGALVSLHEMSGGVLKSGPKERRKGMRRRLSWVTVLGAVLVMVFAGVALAVLGEKGKPRL